MMALELTIALLERLAAEAEKARPAECCGILVGEGDQISAIMPAQNVHPTPKTHFEIDPKTLIDAHRAARNGGPQVVGYYHSHPSGPAQPSRTDEETAAGDNAIWAIIAPRETTWWRDTPDGFSPLPYTVADG